MNKAVFIDRDGTIIEDVGYVVSPQQIKFIPGVTEAIKLLNSAGYKVIVISNQSGIARGLLTEDMLQTIDKIIHRQLLNGGAQLDGVYYCPHHPEYGVYPYKQTCECRKPHPGLVKKAAKNHQVDLAQSFMVGDKATDIETGKRAGIKSILVLTGRGKEEKEKLNNSPDFVADNLLTAVEWILQDNSLRPFSPLTPDFFGT